MRERLIGSCKYWDSRKLVSFFMEEESVFFLGRLMRGQSARTILFLFGAVRL